MHAHFSKSSGRYSELFSQEKYINKVLDQFRVQDAKPRITPLGVQLKLLKAQAPKTKEEQDHIAIVPYSSVVGNLMYAAEPTYLMQWI